jgi:hypothetical protein
MMVARPTAFWIVIAIVALLMLVLLREILLPFAIGMVLAYLLVPAVDRLERVGINRGPDPHPGAGRGLRRPAAGDASGARRRVEILH